MSQRQWMVLLMLFLTYLLLGASIFYHIESRLEISKVAQARKERIEINDLLSKFYKREESMKLSDILQRLTDYCGKSVHNYTQNETDPLKWDFYNSFYFAYTVVSTIGYGNLAPTNMLSRVLMIFYGVIGIPMNGILLAQLGEYFGLVFVRAHKKYKSYKVRSNTECTEKLTLFETRKAGLAAQIFMYLTPGFVMFIFFPAFLFSYYEGWNYDEAVYYAFVTLTTIGFGDYVAGQDNTKGSGVLFVLYKTFLIAWISFGLGYIVMIMTFIATGMRSKKIVRLEHKLAMNLKHTQSKIWNEFNKEVDYLRRVFNELQLSKVKPVYVGEYDNEAPPAKFPRSNSFPDLRDLVIGGLASPLPPHPRRRANSEVVPMETLVVRVVSETDLQRIDKNATFATHAMVQPAELLARLVNILGYIPPPMDDATDTEMDQSPSVESPSMGVQGFGDEEILAGERGLNNQMWKLGDDDNGNKGSRKPRSRATSEVHLDPRYDPGFTERNIEWTWSGPLASRKIQELIKARRNNGRTNGNATRIGQTTGVGKADAKSRFSNLGLPVMPKTLLPRWIKQLSGKRIDNSESDDRETYLTQPSGGMRANNEDTSRCDGNDSASRQYFTHTGVADLANSLENSNLLEETSLADFMRALTALHTRVAVALPDDSVKKPQRKMGTASLTPPKLPSFLALFSPPHGATSANQSNQNTVTSAGFYNDRAGRRFSLRSGEISGTSTITRNSRNSLTQPLASPGRRFSLRPVITPLGQSPQSLSPHLSEIREKQRTGPTTPPPMEYLGQMDPSAPITSDTIFRRSSLRPTVQTDISQSAAQAPTTIGKGLPRWRAGMLQRQINQINLQKRVRAFSLSDVNTEGTSRTMVERIQPPAVSPLVDGVRILGVGKDRTSRYSQKTVTIVSPRSEELAAAAAAARGINDSMQTSAVDNIGKSDIPRSQQEISGKKSFRTRIPMLRAFSATNNPFAFAEEVTSGHGAKPFTGDDATSRALVDPEAQRDALPLDQRETNERRMSSDERSTETEISSLISGEPSDRGKKQSTSSCSTETTDTTVVITSREDSPIFTGTQTPEIERNGEGKFSNLSQRSSTNSVDVSSRKSSLGRSNDEPRVSVDSYERPMQARIEKSSQDPFERYRARMEVSLDDDDSLSEVKVDSRDSHDERKISEESHRDTRVSNT